MKNTADQGGCYPQRPKAAGCTFDVTGSIFSQQQLVMVNYVCGFNQSETEKYFE